MASTSQPHNPPVQRLYLVTPAIVDPAAMPADFGAALAASGVAAVMLRLAPADEGSLTRCAKALAPAIQEAGAALLIDGHDEIIGRTGADGSHVNGVDLLADAIGHLKPDRIVGVGGLITRHDAMVAAETGADYVMFGEPDAQGERPAFEAIVERVEWWSEVFQSPCVAYAGTAEEIAPLAAAGADFIAIGPFVFDDPRGLTAALNAAAQLAAEARA